MKFVNRFAYLSVTKPPDGMGIKLSTQFSSYQVPLFAPSITNPMFDHKLTLSHAIRVMDTVDNLQFAHLKDDESCKWNLIGVGLGAYVACRWASLHPGKVNAIALLQPELSPHSQWSHLWSANRQPPISRKPLVF